MNNKWAIVFFALCASQNSIGMFTGARMPFRKAVKDYSSREAIRKFISSVNAEPDLVEKIPSHNDNLVIDEKPIVPNSIGNLKLLTADRAHSQDVGVEILLESGTIRNLIQDSTGKRVEELKIDDMPKEVPLASVRDEEDLQNIIFVLKENYKWFHEKNVNDLGLFVQKCTLERFISLMNTIDDLDLAKSNQPKKIMTPSVPEYLEYALVNKVDFIEGEKEEYDLLRLLRPEVAGKATTQLLEKNHIPRIICESYSKKLYGQTEKISLPPYERIYYFSEDLVIYVYHNKLYVKKSGQEPKGYSILAQLFKGTFSENDMKTLANMSEEEPLYIKHLNEQGSVLLLANPKIEVSRDHSFFTCDFSYNATQESEKTGHTFFYGDLTSMELNLLEGPFCSTCFISPDCFYLGDSRGNLYSFNCKQPYSDANPVLVESWQNFGVRDPIVGIKTNESGTIIIIKTKDGIYRGKKSNDSFIFQQLEITIKDIFKDRSWISLSPDGKWLLIRRYNSEGDELFYVYDTFTTHAKLLSIRRPSLEHRSQFDVRWALDSNLLLLNYVDKYDGCPMNKYLFFPVCSFSSYWELGCEQSCIDVKSKVQEIAQPDVPRVKNDATQSIEDQRRLLGSDCIVEQLIDKNMQATLQFLSPITGDKIGQLIGVALLNCLIKNDVPMLSPTSIRREKPMGSLAALYDALPEAVRSVWELNVSLPNIPNVGKEDGSLANTQKKAGYRSPFTKFKNIVRAYRIDEILDRVGLWGLMGFGLYKLYGIYEGAGKDVVKE
jgi:hypothetical protein